MNRSKGMFMGRKRTEEGYSPHHGNDEKRGPCRRSHSFRHHQKFPRLGKAGVVLRCTRCGWETDLPPEPDEPVAA